MPVWLQIIIAIFGLIGTILGTVGITAYINERMKHKAQKKNLEEDKREAEIEALKHQKYLTELRSIIREENETSITPINDRLGKLENQLTVVAAGTTDILRERLLSTYYKCMEKGYRTQYDYENVEHMHKEYIGLGGNSFVASCVKAIKDLPSEEEWKSKRKAGRKPKSKKQILLEEKK